MDQLRNVFTFETSLGIIGGRPKHAVYFVGFHDDVRFIMFYYKKNNFRNFIVWIHILHKSTKI